MTFPQVKSRTRRKPYVRPDLPQFYYHTNFCHMLTFVEERYTHTFEDAHVEFLENFRALSHDAQCLYVRIAGRKGQVFDSHKLVYPEITAVPRALRTLEMTGFITPVDALHFEACLSTMTKPDLTTFMSARLCATAFKRSWKKDVLVATCLAHVSFETATLPPKFILQGRADALRYISYLHFGKIEDNLQSFTMRDLGITRTPDFKADYSARFETLQEAKSAYFYADALHKFKHGSDTDVTHFVDCVDHWPAPECDISLAARDKLLQKLGGLSERLGDVETALGLYARSDAPLSNERVIRLRYGQGDKAWCKARLEGLIENPGSDGEHNFAQDFYARKFEKKRTSEVTDILRGGDTIDVDEAFKNTPERAVADYYIARGYDVHFTENQLWRTVFGLLFWEELYCAETATLHNSFEKTPMSLKTGTFYQDNQTPIETKLSNLGTPSDVHIQILKTVSRHHGTPNGIFRWRGASIDLIKTFMETAPSAPLASMLRLMAQDYKRTKDGFPDLMLIKDGDVRFTEVKAKGDVIRRNQLTRIKQLRAAGFKTDITRINWAVNPNQIYVVVDVETTGGKAGNHRVTEIGAVKVQNGHVIDEFQTLLNPERSIPAFITKLTGITHDMVKDAPRFEEVADSFRGFMGDAIFAAHNVNFDYGFIKAEYARLDQKFRHAKICTCASMRKHYPGHRSYSLKNLCQAYQIDLTTHHRALCDAQAAAELLFLVNDKRLERG